MGLDEKLPSGILLKALDHAWRMLIAGWRRERIDLSEPSGRRTKPPNQPSSMIVVLKHIRLELPRRPDAPVRIGHQRPATQFAAVAAAACRITAERHLDGALAVSAYQRCPRRAQPVVRRVHDKISISRDYNLTGTAEQRE